MQVIDTPLNLELDELLRLHAKVARCTNNHERLSLEMEHQNKLDSFRRKLRKLEGHES